MGCACMCSCVCVLVCVCMCVCSVCVCVLVCVHMFVCVYTWGMHVCTHMCVAGCGEAACSLLVSSCILSSSHPTVLRGKGGPGCPHPGTELESTSRALGTKAAPPPAPTTLPDAGPSAEQLPGLQTNASWPHHRRLPSLTQAPLPFCFLQAKARAPRPPDRNNWPDGFWAAKLGSLCLSALVLRSQKKRFPLLCLTCSEFWD